MLEFKLGCYIFLLSPSRSWLRVQEATEAEKAKAKRDGGKWPGEPKTSPFFSVFIYHGGHTRSHGPNLPHSMR